MHDIRIPRRKRESAQDKEEEKTANLISRSRSRVFVHAKPDEAFSAYIIGMNTMDHENAKLGSRDAGILMTVIHDNEYD